MSKFSGPYKIKHLGVNDPAPKLSPAYTKGYDAENDVIYIKHWDGIPQRAIFQCPCGECERLVELNLDPEWRSSEVPCWTFQESDGIPTISPSIHRVGGRGCHFFLRNGYVEWC